MRLYNTLARMKEELVPRDEGRITMYSCGPTVYDVPHFGHARAAIVPDVLRRYLAWRGYDVLHVRNVTDVEDKIIARAHEEQRSAAEVAEDYTRAYDVEMDRLGILPPHIAPRATGHIDDMVELIEELVAKGAAYEVDGDVYFSVRAFDDYGKLSGRDVDELRAGARVEPDERKHDPADFALWKAAKIGEPSWRSPWGRGRPGWHIECSAMSVRHLGLSFDIHTGGLDLVFPHHENELAQSEAATGKTFARYWVHNGLLSIAGEKMSKSLGNVISLSEALDRHGANVVRMFYLGVDYRSPLELSEERLAEAAAAVDRWEAFLRAARGLAAGAAGPPEVAQARERFVAAMDDDLSTPAAQAALFDLVSAGNQHLAAGRSEDAAAVRDELLALAGVLGYGLGADVSAGAGLVAALVEELLAVRERARADRDFAAADAVRARLAALGIAVEDSPGGARWHLM